MAILGKVFIGLSILGVVLIVLGAVLGWVVFPEEIESQVAENVELINGTEQWDRFVTLPLPLQFRMYFFHINNTDEVSQGAKPNLEERGPYVYTEYREKYDLTYDEDSDTISYYERQWYEFDPVASSPRTEDDEIRIINLVLVSAFHIIESAPFPDAFKDLFLSTLDQYAEDLFGEYDVFMNITVGDLVHRGYRFCTPDLGPDPTDLCNNLIRAQVTGIKQVEIEDDGTISFAIFNNRNNTHDGKYTIKSGISDVQQIGLIQAWNDLQYIDTWVGGNSTCNFVHGRDSKIYSPMVEEGASFAIFSTDICRVMNIHYVAESSFKGIDAYRFEMEENSFSTPSVEDGTDCYCLNQSHGIDREDGCLLDGAIDMATCYGTQLVITQPHFLYADEAYSSTVNGLNPSVDRHLTFVDIEPYTGTPIRGAKRVQFNMFMYEVPSAPLTAGLPRTLIPFMWVDETFELTDELRDMMNSELFDVLTGLDAAKWTLIAVGIVMTIVFFILYIRLRRKTAKENKIFD